MSLDIHQAAWAGDLEGVLGHLGRDRSAAAARDSTVFGGGNTPLHYAAYRGHLPIINALLRVDPSQLNAVNEAGCSPLFFAAQQDNEAAVRALMEAGADPLLVDAQNGFLPSDVTDSAGVRAAIAAGSTRLGLRCVPPPAGARPSAGAGRPPHVDPTDHFVTASAGADAVKALQADWLRAAPVSEGGPVASEASVPADRALYVTSEVTFEAPLPGTGVTLPLPPTQAEIILVALAALPGGDLHVVHRHTFDLPPPPPPGLPGRRREREAHTLHLLISGLPRGRSYTARVRLCNALGWGAWSPPAAPAVAFPHTPSPPTLLAGRVFAIADPVYTPPAEPAPAPAPPPAPAPAPAPVIPGRPREKPVPVPAPAPVEPPPPPPPPSLPPVSLTLRLRPGLARGAPLKSVLLLVKPGKGEEAPSKGKVAGGGLPPRGSVTVAAGGDDDEEEGSNGRPKSRLKQAIAARKAAALAVAGGADAAADAPAPLSPVWLPMPVHTSGATQVKTSGPPDDRVDVLVPTCHVTPLAATVGLTDVTSDATPVSDDAAWSAFYPHAARAVPPAVLAAMRSGGWGLLGGCGPPMPAAGQLQKKPAAAQSDFSHAATAALVDIGLPAAAAALARAALEPTYALTLPLPPDLLVAAYAAGHGHVPGVGPNALTLTLAAVGVSDAGASVLSPPVHIAAALDGPLELALAALHRAAARRALPAGGGAAPVSAGATTGPSPDLGASFVSDLSVTWDGGATGASAATTFAPPPAAPVARKR